VAIGYFLFRNPWPRPYDMGKISELKHQESPEAKAVLSPSRQGGPQFYPVKCFTYFTGAKI